MKFLLAITAAAVASAQLQECLPEYGCQDDSKFCNQVNKGSTGYICEDRNCTPQESTGCTIQGGDCDWFFATQDVEDSADIGLCARCVRSTYVEGEDQYWMQDFSAEIAAELNPDGTAGVWCPDAQPLEGSCVDHCGSSDPVPNGADDEECYCDSNCEDSDDCCNDYEVACPKPVDVTLCGTMNTLLETHCPDEVADFYRPAWVIAIDRRNGCAAPEPASNQPDDVRCIPATSGARGNYLKFACAGITQDIVVDVCRDRNCDKCEEDWSTFDDGSVEAGKCADVDGSSWLFVCDLPKWDDTSDN